MNGFVDETQFQNSYHIRALKDYITNVSLFKLQIKEKFPVSSGKIDKPDKNDPLFVFGHGRRHL